MYIIVFKKYLYSIILKINILFFLQSKYNTYLFAIVLFIINIFMINVSINQSILIIIFALISLKKLIQIILELIQKLNVNIMCISIIHYLSSLILIK